MIDLKRLEKFMILRGDYATRTKLGQICGVSQPAATHKFNGSPLTRENIVALAKYYNMDLRDFIEIFFYDLYELEE